MGEVYKARDPRIGRDVAVKVLPKNVALDAERQRRFELEVKAAGALDHPNVMAIHDVGTHDGAPFVVSEMLQGETLRERMEAGRIPQRKALEFAAQIARGLAAAHEKNIVHRDLKPENLFVTSDGRVKILDFGLAKVQGPFGADEATLSKDELGTDPGTILGTIGYMSPEQVRGKPADPRSDLFSFGAVLYEMLSGRKAFKRDGKVETMNAILKDDPPDLSQPGSEISPVVDRVVRRCLEKRPEERFHSAHDLGLALEALSGSSDKTHASDAPAPDAARDFARNRRRYMFIAAITTVAFARGAYLLIERSQKPAAPPTHHRLTFRRGFIRSARFAPDGQTTLYSAQWDGDPSRLFTVRPESADSRALGVGDADLFAVSSTGELAIGVGRQAVGRSGAPGSLPATLARVPLGGGEPREVAANVLFADWSPDGRQLAVVRFPEGRGGKQLLEFPLGTVIHETPTGRAMVTPRFSRKGDQIAYIDSAGGDLGGAVTLLTLGGHPGAPASTRRITREFPSIESLAWKGDEIVFTASSSLTSGENDIYAVAPSGGDVRLLYRGTGTLRVHDAAPDGRLLVTSDNQRMGIMLGERDLSWLDGSLLADITPDGKRIVFTETFSGGGQQRGVYMRQTDGSPAVRLGDGLARAISPDGKWAITMPGISAKYLELVPTGAGETKKIDGQGVLYWTARFLKGGERLVAKGHEEGKRPRLWLQSIAGGKPRPITPEGVDIWSVSPEGTRVAANLNEPAILLYPIEGGDPQPLRGAESGDQLFHGGWIDGGRALLVVKVVEGTLHISRIDLVTGRREKWKELHAPDIASVASNPWLLSTPDGRNFAYSYYRSLSDLYVVTGLR
jgi:hypothetical protein